MRKSVLFPLLVILLFGPIASPTEDQLPCADFNDIVLWGVIDKTAQAWDSLLLADNWEAQPEKFKEFYWAVFDAKTSADSFKIVDEWNMRRYVLQWDSLTQKERCIVRIAHRWKKRP